MVREWSLLNYFASKTQISILRCCFFLADDWLKTGWAQDSQTCTWLVDSLICITCSLENNGFSVQHCAINIALRNYMLHWFKIFSAPGIIVHGSTRLLPFSLVPLRGCWLAITLESSQVKHTPIYMYINLHSINELIIWKLNL